ncbi:unnamed protein product [Phytophthora lilii]|uniref:Unnamed protein product n=1 Tax=Phytophthora lilii TaxID=2077276 RepID=A0A9W6XDM2_9STRA|nr:unnamed protein product [Phytophthora lilii]
MPSLQQEHGDLTSVDVDGAGVPSTTENHRSWALDDIEGVVMEVLEDVMWGSAGQAIEKVVSDRLFGYVCAWGSTILEEVLASAIAPTGDVAVDSSDSTILNNYRVLLGRSELAFESLDPPKDCPVDDSYQRRQVPVRAAKRNHYDSESLHHAVKAAARSHTHPASITSSRLTMKSKMRRKQHGTGASQVELSGPQPGVPFSTEVHENHHSGRQRILSPRKVKVISQPIGTENATEYRDAGGTPPLWDPHFNSNTAGAGLQLNIDTESIRQGNSVSSTKARRSPPPLSRSPSSIASARRRPHPPGSAQSAQASKTICFGEREEEVKVEYAVQKSPPRRSSASLKGVLPDIDSGRMTPRPSVLYQAFGAIPNNHAVDEDIDKSSLFDEDPLDQHFHAMPLSPGVKLRAGDESNDGPELPLFASRMCRSTFVVSCNRLAF